MNVRPAVVACILAVGASSCVPPPDPRTAPVATPGASLPDVSGPPSAIRAMVRVRSLACDALSVGSGFAVDDHTIITNRHVVAGASAVSADTWDGRPLDVVATRVSTTHDLALLTVSGRLDTTIPLAGATGPPGAGTPVSVIGYPFGEALRVVDATIATSAESDPGSLVFSGEVHHGNSGGPVVDAEGTVVGVVHRKILGDVDAGLALPSAVVNTNLADDTFIDNPDCARAGELFGDD